MFNRVKDFFLDIKDVMFGMFFTSNALKDLRAEPIADYILELYSSEEFNIELLQKRLYLIQLEWLSYYGDFLFKDLFVARRFGPEIPIIAWKFRKGGVRIVCEKAQKIQLPDYVKRFIKRKLKKYEDISKLDEQVLGSAWLNTWFGSEGDGKTILPMEMEWDHPVRWKE